MSFHHELQVDQLQQLETIVKLLTLQNETLMKMQAALQTQNEIMAKQALYSGTVRGGLSTASAQVVQNPQPFSAFIGAMEGCQCPHCGTIHTKPATTELWKL